MKPETEIVGVYILNARCGKCQHIAYCGHHLMPFICKRRWIHLPTLANINFACECPYFKPYEYRITMNQTVLNIIKRG